MIIVHGVQLIIIMWQGLGELFAGVVAMVCGPVYCGILLDLLNLFCGLALLIIFVSAPEVIPDRSTAINILVRTSYIHEIK